MMSFFKTKKRRILLLCLDFLCILLSCIVSCFLLLSVRQLSYSKINEYIYASLIFSGFSVFSMYTFGAYKVMWRYARMKDIINSFVFLLFPTVLFMILAILYDSNAAEIWFAFSGLCAACAVSVMRACYASLYNYTMHRNANNTTNNVMIVGAGAGGRHICDMMKTDKTRYNPVVFIDDDSNKIGLMINGVPVKGNTNEIPKIASKMNIREIVLAIPSISSEDKTRILNICYETMCKINVLPDLPDYIESEKITQQMKNVKIEDLLGRDVVNLNNSLTSEMIRDKVCMITGGGGSIGSELTRQIAKMNPRRLVVVDIYENNAYDIQQELLAKYGEKLDLSVQIASVRDEDKLEKLFVEFKPQLVFHAAAHKHVPLMETNPEEAIKNNVFGTLNTARLAKKYEVEKFVLVSTDKAVNPTNIMGATKRCCEMIVECMAQSKSKTEFVAVRFGNVLGSNGSVIPLFEKQIANGGPITVTDPNIIRYFMTIPEAASLILQAATMARGGEIFVLDMGEPVKILKLAENLIRLHGYRPYKDIDIVFSGLRPGEKLYEELLMDEEGLKNTANHKIFIGNQMQVDEKDFLQKLELLEQAAQNNDKDEVERILKIIVPTFVRKKQPQNSENIKENMPVL